ncbi:hypothetical protein PCASD_02306 [Puccinia coronata f. sp. avenae]|uniref:Uncharacterized protein n=1 Tax=Puccinia coronata f. sp. avenae TaxID=200324 RepID=A0A2N5VB75_9BASI|nr:hypothetical protein PCASD_02306 [Puccinia coronata f. sp. avenae]
MSAKLFQCMEIIQHAIAAADVPTVGTRVISDLHYMNLKDARHIRKEYENANHRLIFIGESNGLLHPINNANAATDHERLQKSLSNLAQDPKNEIWIYTDHPVMAIEQAYSLIPRLNFAGDFAGYHGIQLGANNVQKVNLPDTGVIDNIAAHAIAKNTDFSNFAVGSTTPSTLPAYYREYFVPYGREFQSSSYTVYQMKREMEAVIIVNREFHDYEAKVLEFTNGYVLRLQHKYLHNKKMLVEALFNKKQENPIDFALSLGSTQDEMIHHSQFFPTTREPRLRSPSGGIHLCIYSTPAARAKHPSSFFPPPPANMGYASEYEKWTADLADGGPHWVGQLTSPIDPTGANKQDWGAAGRSREEQSAHKQDQNIRNQTTHKAENSKTLSEPLISLISRANNDQSRFNKLNVAPRSLLTCISLVASNHSKRQNIDSNA